MNYLDMWYKARFVADNKTFWSVGQYMAYAKAVFLGEDTIAGYIAVAGTRKEVEFLESKLKDTSSWKLRYPTNLREGIENKLLCNEDLLKKFTSDSRRKVDLAIGGSDNPVLAKAVLKEVHNSFKRAKKEPSLASVLEAYTNYFNTLSDEDIKFSGCRGKNRVVLLHKATSAISEFVDLCERFRLYENKVENGDIYQIMYKLICNNFSFKDSDWEKFYLDALKYAVISGGTVKNGSEMGVSDTADFDCKSEIFYELNGILLLQLDYLYAKDTGELIDIAKKCRANGSTVLEQFKVSLGFYLKKGTPLYKFTEHIYCSYYEYNTDRNSMRRMYTKVDKYTQKLCDFYGLRRR